MDEAVRSMPQPDSLVLETTGTELYGPLGCPALGITANDVIKVEIKLTRREGHACAAISSEDPIKRAEERKAKVCSFVCWRPY